LLTPHNGPMSPGHSWIKLLCNMYVISSTPVIQIFSFLLFYIGWNYFWTTTLHHTWHITCSSVHACSILNYEPSKIVDFFYIRLWDTGIVGRMLRTDLIHIFGDRQYATNHIGKSQIWCRVAYCWENIWNLMNKCHHPIVIQDIITLIKYLFVG